MNEENGEEPGLFKNIDCSGAFNTSQVFEILILGTDVV